MKLLEGSRVLITGAVGTVGAELTRQLLNNCTFKIRELIALDNNESESFFCAEKYRADSRAQFYVNDIRDLDALTQHMKGVDYVFHAAALKHVMLSEKSPDQVLQTNAIGVQNVIKAAQSNDVKTVIFTSSDKAVNPTNVMGASKLLGERLMTAANNNNRDRKTVFSSTRFGNVLGSSGSVIPIFEAQIAAGGPVTLTHKNMSRFVMSIEQAVSLVIKSAEMAIGGEVFVTKMPAVLIEDLAKALILEIAPIHGHDPASIEIVEVGVKPGEKLYEELVNTEEVRRTVELDNYFSVLPAFNEVLGDIKYDYQDLTKMTIDQPFTSENQPHLSINEIRVMLNEYGLFQSSRIRSVPNG